MNFIKYAFVSFLISISFSVSFAQTQIKAGAAKVNITPALGGVINGDFMPYYVQNIHDSLYSKALAFDNGKTRFVFIVVDNMTLDGPLIKDCKTMLKNQLGLNPSQIMISSTHAHSCGALMGNGTCPGDVYYRLSLPAKVVMSAKQALAKLKPAKIAWGNFDLEKYTSCRRWYMKPGFKIESPFGETEKVWMNPEPGSPYMDRPVSPTDPQVSFLAVKDLNNKYISILANYSIHYAADVALNTISGDYFGEVHKQLKEKLNTGDDFVGIMCNGTSGDVNTTDFKLERNYPKEPNGKSKLIANDVTDLIINKLQTCVYDKKPNFGYRYKEIPLKRREISADLLAKSKLRVAKFNYQQIGTIDKGSSTFSDLYAMEVLVLDEYFPKNENAPIQAIKLGEGIIGTLPGEIFAETGLNLKKSANRKYYFTVGLANDQLGYMPPAEQFKLGGYETWLCTGSHMEVGAEQKLFNGLSSLVRSLK
jgi:neutral ceramidase